MYSIFRFMSRPCLQPERGKQILRTVTLSDSHVSTAKRLGDGNVSQGIRVALERADDTTPPAQAKGTGVLDDLWA